MRFIFPLYTDYYPILANNLTAYAVIIYLLLKPYSASFPYIFLSTIKVPSINKNAAGRAIAMVLTKPAIIYDTKDTAATVNA